MFFSSCRLALDEIHDMLPDASDDEIFAIEAPVENQNQIKSNLYYTSTGYIYNTTILHNHIQKAPINL